MQLWICIRRAVVLPIEHGVLVKIYGNMSSGWAATSGFFRNTVQERDSSGERESSAAMGLQENDANTGKER